MYMEQLIVEPLVGSIFKADYDGISYEFKLTSYENVAGYAKIIVLDKTNDERYLSDGYLEINNHVIISKWKKEYSRYRDNWISSRELIIIIQ